MRIGVVSDTHDHLPNVRRIVALFNAAGVERVVHTGDITQAKTLELLSALAAPVYGVFGNNDLERPSLDAAIARHGFRFTEPPLRVAWAGREIVVVHDPRALEALPPAAVALHGHTHRRVVERRGERLVFNPGECAGHLPGHNVVGVVDLGALSVELLHF